MRHDPQTQAAIFRQRFGQANAVVFDGQDGAFFADIKTD